VPRKAPILIQHQPENPSHWRRFVAVLCFIEFYVHFVNIGHDVFTFDARGPRSVSDPLIPWIGGLLIARACVFYLLGRSLWLGRGRPVRWMIAAGAVSFVAMTAMGSLGAWISGPSPWTFFSGMWSLGVDKPSVDTWLAATHLLAPWLSMLIAAALYWRWSRRRPGRHLSLWVVLAAAWIGDELIRLATQGHMGSYLVQVLAMCFGSLWDWPGTATLLGYSALLALLVAALLLGWRRVRVVPLLLAGLTTAVMIQEVYTNGMLLMRAVQALYYSTTMSLEEANALVFWPDYFVLNKWSFQWLFVHLPGQAGPWLLIAIYAWRVPMRALPDDGSPYPRQYCGRCHYNLHGLDATRCPECGSELAPLAPTTRKRILRRLIIGR
jgi:hypothetical protein